MRDDTLSMGAYGDFPLRAVDTTAWLRAGLQSLNEDLRLLLKDKPDASTLVLNADLLKAYVMDSAQEARATNVVLRVHFSRQGVALGDKTYRGADAGLNWTGSKSETQSSLNDALGQIIDALDRDVPGYCDQRLRRTPDSIVARDDRETGSKTFQLELFQERC